MANDPERTLLRKWYDIWSVGAVALIFVPCLLAFLEIIEEKHVASFLMIYVIFFMPTVGMHAQQAAALRQ